MIMRRFAASAFLFLAVAFPLHAETDTASRIRRVENGLLPPVLVKGEPAWNLTERMEHYKVPGVSVAVIENYRIVWAKAYGVADAQTKAPVTEQTLFQAASISKTLNATAIMRKVQEGKLSLDEDVNAYLRSWKLPGNEFTAAKKVTIANLLSHTGGTTVSSFPGYKMGTPIPTAGQILKGEPPANTAAIVVDTAPGVAFRYSGGGTTILQLLLTELENKPYPQIMKETVLDPLGMTGSNYGQPLPPELRPFAASGHGPDGMPVDGKCRVYPELAAAGLWTTPTDLAKFAIEHQLSFAGKSNKLLSKEVEMRMVTPYISPDFGLGFSIQNIGAGVYFVHSGGNLGYRCCLIASRDKGHGAVVMTNGVGDQLYFEILRSIAKEYSWDGYLSEPYELVAVSPDRLQRFAGRYLIDVDQTATVTVNGDHLKADVTGEPSTELYPISEDEFIRRDRDSKARFVAGSGSGGGALQIREGAFTQSFARMSDDQRTPYEDLGAGNIEAALARYREIRTGNPSSPAIAENRINSIGYGLMGKGSLREAIAAFKLNVEFHPSSFNAFDSLAEAYMNAGDRQLAIENYEKSLELNPRNANAVAMLKKLRE